MRKLILMAAMLGVLAAPLAQAQAASFNCRYARYPDEVAICQSPSLSALDEEMASLYFDVLQRLRQEGDWRALRAIKRGQHRWLLGRHRCGYNFRCIRRSIERRIDYLSGWL